LGNNPEICPRRQIILLRREGEPCPRCGTRIEAIHFKDYVMCYCPEEQTNGRVLKDRRLSRLLK
jgi:formamidopyrimidine-DNA glycosylase